jgi:type VI secretion system secreted protein VgrG
VSAQYVGHLEPADTVSVSTLQLAIGASGGNFSVMSYDFEQATQALVGSAAAGGFGDHLEFDQSLLTSDEVQHRAMVNQGRDSSASTQLTGTGNATGFRSGLIAGINGGSFSGGYLLTQVKHIALADLDNQCVTYANAFIASASTSGYRPPKVTPKVRVSGPTTAVVTVPTGEPAWTDQFGRVKVQFHWDRYGESNEQSSGWIRVMVPAGRQNDFRSDAPVNESELYLPLPGTEVVVDFLEGDPDLPIVLGEVHNSANMPPLPLPACQLVPPGEAGCGGSNQTNSDLQF